MSKIVRIGTMVKVRNNLEELRDDYHRINGIFVDETMLEQCGKEFKVNESYWSNDLGQNIIRLDGVPYYSWNLDMFEEVNDIDMIDVNRICSRCNSEVEEGQELVYLERYEKWVCQDCLDTYYVQCADCGDYISRDVATLINNDYYVCDDCYSNGYYFRCDDCGNRFSEEYINHSQDRWGDDVDYCNDCYNHHDAEDLICGYHNYPRDFKEKLASGETKAPRLYGTELEMENDYVDSECVHYLKDHFDAILAHDGSLESAGAMEWVDDPRSIKNIYEVAEEKRKAFELLVKNGYRSHKTSTCGLHIHVTRPYYNEIRKLDPYTEEGRAKITKYKEMEEDTIDRIILVMETFKEELLKFSRRTSTEWCKWLSDVVRTDEGKITSLEFIKKNKHESMGHHRALNLENSKTIEFRIFKGTLNFDTYMASIELVHNIMELCSDLKLPLEKITWSKLTKGQYVRKYVEEKGIKSNKHVVDTSAVDKVWEHIKERKYIKAIKNLKVELNKYYEHYTKRFNDIKDSENWDDIGMIVSRIREYCDNMSRVENSIKSKDYKRAIYQISELRSYSMYFDNTELVELGSRIYDILNNVKM